MSMSAVDEDFIREIAIKRMREGDKKVGKAGKGDVSIERESLQNLLVCSVTGAAINAPILPKSATPPMDPAVLRLKVLCFLCVNKSLTMVDLLEYFTEED